MKIAGTNYSVLSLKASTSLLRTQKAIARSLERLASGQRVSSPRDDAHAYVQGVGLTAQIRGLTQANFGLNTGLGMVATAESAVSTQMNIVQRMRELAVQASNGSLTNLQRSMLNEEVQTLLEEYNRITAQTDFNGTKLLDGSFTTINLQAGANKGNSIGFTIGSTQARSVFVQRTTVGDGTFQSATTSEIGYLAIQAKSFDFNDDGNMDVLTTDTGTLSVSILLGNGNGTFQARTTISTGDMPSGSAVKDINHDGILDLAITVAANDVTLVYLGNGDGTFSAPTTVTSGDSPQAIQLVDVNGDGKEDLLTSDTTSTHLSIYLGNGNGTFGSRSTQSFGYVLGFTARDLNGDGKIDIASSSQTTNSLDIYLGNGNGTFQSAVTFADGSYEYSDPAVVDINGDGKLDILTAVADESQISIFLGNGNGTFQNRTTIVAGTYSYGISYSDLNGDGNIDLVTPETSGDGTISIYLGNGNGTFKSKTTLSASGDPIAATIADFNNDGAADIYYADFTNSTGYLFLANATESSSVATVSIATQEDAEAMLQVFDDAMAALSETQANLGAIHSRLNVAVASNLILSDNLVEARSKALDTDYATEVAELVRNQILQDAGLAVLAQANLNQQLVLKLLNFGERA